MPTVRYVDTNDPNEDDPNKKNFEITFDKQDFTSSGSLKDIGKNSKEDKTLTLTFKDIAGNEFTKNITLHIDRLRPSLTTRKVYMKTSPKRTVSNKVYLKDGEKFVIEVVSNKQLSDFRINVFDMTATFENNTSNYIQIEAIQGQLSATSTPWSYRIIVTIPEEDKFQINNQKLSFGITDIYDSFDKPNLGNPLTYEFIDQDEDEYDNIYIDNVLPVLNKVTVQGFFDSVNVNTGVKVQYQLVDQSANKGDTIKINIEASKKIYLDAVKIRDNGCIITQKPDNTWLAEYKIPNSWYKELDGVVGKEVYQTDDETVKLLKIEFSDIFGEEYTIYETTDESFVQIDTSPLGLELIEHPPKYSNNITPTFKFKSARDVRANEYDVRFYPYIDVTTFTPTQLSAGKDHTIVIKPPSFPYIWPPPDNPNADGGTILLVAQETYGADGSELYVPSFEISTIRPIMTIKTKGGTNPFSVTPELKRSTVLTFESSELIKGNFGINDIKVEVYNSTFDLWAEGTTSSVGGTNGAEIILKEDKNPIYKVEVKARQQDTSFPMYEKYRFRVEENKFFDKFGNGNKDTGWQVVAFTKNHCNNCPTMTIVNSTVKNGKGRRDGRLPIANAVFTFTSSKPTTNFDETNIDIKYWTTRYRDGGNWHTTTTNNLNFSPVPGWSSNNKTFKFKLNCNLFKPISIIFRVNHGEFTDAAGNGNYHSTYPGLQEVRPARSIGMIKTINGEKWYTIDLGDRRDEIN